jgi:hypothetical protein
MPGGRPTEFREEFIEQAKKLAQLGATDMEIADFFRVDVRTIHRWKIVHLEFCHSLNIAKEQADARVERSLFQRSIGYERDAVKIFCNKDGEVTTVPYREIVPPDTTAMIFWLKNRRPKEWRDRTEYTGADGGPIQLVSSIPRPPQE